jgi:hypothetical protein
MPFTVHPAETQAMQEDEAQLLTAIAQTTRSAISLLRQTQPQAQPKPEAPEIRMNGRQIYGAMADGQFRNELNAEDGVVTVNQFQYQLQSEQVAQSEPALDEPTQPQPETLEPSQEQGLEL